MDIQAKVARAHELCDRIMHFGDILRSHQIENIRLLRAIADGLGGADWPFLTSPGFLVEEIVPGGGKSFNAVACASVLVGSGLYDTAVWISPRLTLIQQAKDDFSSTGLAMARCNQRVSVFNPANLKPHEAPNNIGKLLDRNIKVWVMSYQRLTTNGGMLAMLSQLVESRNVLLIFDEFQLFRDVSAGREELGIDGHDGWYRSICPLVEACQKRMNFGGVILSGSLSRNDNYKLPHITYRHGDPMLGEDAKREFPMSDISYTLSEAQADQSIIKIDIDFYDGEVTFKLDDEQDSESISAMSSGAYNAKLEYYLEQPEVWQTIINDMLTSLDAYNPPGQGYRARYMVISKSIKDAEMHKKYLESIGRRPFLIHSKMSDSAKKKLDEFRRGYGEWDGIITVAMGYIGLSIPDLSHMAYLSHYRSLAWINQAFHRITRKDNHPRAPLYEHQLARIFTLHDPQMKRIAGEFMRNQNPGVRDRPNPTPPPSKSGSGMGDGFDFAGVDASISGRQFSSNGEHCTEHNFIELALRKLPLLNLLPRKVVEDFKHFSDGFAD